MNATIKAMNPEALRLAHQLEELNARKAELHADMVAAHLSRHDSEWFRDRANELEWLNRQATRLVVLLGSLIGE